MAYSSNPNLPKARAIAMQLLVREQLPVYVVANRCGVSRSTIWRWKRKWETLNAHVQFDNPNRLGRAYSRMNHLHRCAWHIPTESSRPRGHAWAIPNDVIRVVLTARKQLQRCAEVVWHHVTTLFGLSVSLSSVRRILRRHHCFDGARKKRVRPDNLHRPRVTAPGELVQTDTIHHVDPFTGRKLYYYTVIDLYTRMAYAVPSRHLGAGLAARVVLDAQTAFGFPCAMVQADNGPEYSRFFEQTLKRNGIATRHSRLHRPNDNAHIERFNRTIQTECLGYYWRKSVPLSRQQARLTAWLACYNTERIHLGIQMQTPAEMLQRF